MSVPQGFPRIYKTANRKLYQLDAAVSLNSLRVPPGSRLEALKWERKGQRSIRINDQWRICFVWTDADPENVIIEDYHCGSQRVPPLPAGGDAGRLDALACTAHAAQPAKKPSIAAN